MTSSLHSITQNEHTFNFHLTQQISLQELSIITDYLDEVLITQGGVIGHMMVQPMSTLPQLC